MKRIRIIALALPHYENRYEAFPRRGFTTYWPSEDVRKQRSLDLSKPLSDVSE